MSNSVLIIIQSARLVLVFRSGWAIRHMRSLLSSVARTRAGTILLLRSFILKARRFLLLVIGVRTFRILTFLVTLLVWSLVWASLLLFLRAGLTFRLSSRGRLTRSIIIQLLWRLLLRSGTRIVLILGPVIVLRKLRTFISFLSVARAKVIRALTIFRIIFPILNRCRFRSVLAQLFSRRCSIRMCRFFTFLRLRII